MTEEELTAIEQLEAAATDGPWVAIRAQVLPAWAKSSIDGICHMQVSNCPNFRNDLSFITAARSAIPALCAEVRRLQEVVAFCHEDILRLTRELAQTKGAGDD